jgi:antitoxin component YwqK of YwqJK toxin-antitoxin module
MQPLCIGKPIMSVFLKKRYVKIVFLVSFLSFLFLFASFAKNVRKGYYPDGQLKLEIPFENGKPDGQAKVYYKGGTLREEKGFRNGRQHGMSRIYYKNGRLMKEVPYKNGKKHGIEKIYNPDGNLIKELKYKNGEIATENNF